MSDVYTKGAELARAFQDLFVSGRPVTSSIAGMLGGLTLAFGGVRDLRTIISGIAAILALTMAGFVINDIHDRAKDKVRGLTRPITIGRISVRVAGGYSAALILASLLATDSYSARALLACSAIALYWYSFFAKRFPALKGVYTAVLTCTPLLYGALISTTELPTSSYLLLMLFIVGRELHLDVYDSEGDAAYGLRTIPVLIGREAALFVGSSLMVGATVVLSAVVRSTLGIAISLCGTLLLLFVLTWPGVSLDARIRLSRLPMLFLAAALATTFTG